MKYILIFSLIIVFFVSFFLYQKTTLDDQKLHITVCDVGQGDAIHIRTPEGKDILYDGGPDEAVLDCLFRSMPLWDRTIELVILSHPHADHLNGLIHIFESYSVERFVTEDLANTTEGYAELQKSIKNEGIETEFLVRGDRIRTPDGVVLSVLSPTREYLDITADKGRYIPKSGEFANLILHLTYGEFDALLTGDSQAEQVSEAIIGRVGKVELLQVPHHGSRTGLSNDIIDVLQPSIATLSVGEGNDYGHPHPITLSILSSHKTPIHRTDQKGFLRLKTDGKTYNIE